MKPNQQSSLFSSGLDLHIVFLSIKPLTCTLYCGSSPDILWEYVLFKGFIILKSCGFVDVTLYGARRVYMALTSWRARQSHLKVCYASYGLQASLLYELIKRLAYSQGT